MINQLKTRSKTEPSVGVEGQLEQSGGREALFVKNQLQDFLERDFRKSRFRLEDQASGADFTELGKLKKTRGTIITLLGSKHTLGITRARRTKASSN